MTTTDEHRIREIFREEIKAFLAGTESQGRISSTFIEDHKRLEQIKAEKLAKRARRES